ncbi:MAG: MarR family winged helix-turn-helix transcriptional regulator [Terracidiphilus sp.]
MRLPRPASIPAGPTIPISSRRKGSSTAVDTAQLRRLAEFRFQLRRFLHFSQLAAEEAGIPHQQYQLLQCVRGIPAGVEPTIANVAARMFLRHNSAVELVDRTIRQGLLCRLQDERDHRRILLEVTPRGEQFLASLARHHMNELRQSGPDLVRALRHVLRANTALQKAPEKRSRRKARP